MTILAGGLPRAVLFDRDGTLVVDVPYNGDPRRVRVMPSAGPALATLRRAGIRTGVVTNQSAIGSGLISESDVDAVHAEIERQVGRIDVWRVCPHTPADGCECRKPRPGLIISAAASLRMRPAEVAVIGDIGSDLNAATAAGARSVLVPTALTATEEVAAAPCVARDLVHALELLGFPS
jgi:D-glycero-D-manno-heptose 1,7-bisphosphate phosphatase